MKPAQSTSVAALNRDEFARLRQLSVQIRLNALRMVSIQGFGYLGQAFSSAEIFAVLFGGDFLQFGGDRFVLSPGHYVVSLYAVAAEVGLLDKHALSTYGADGSKLEAIGTERTPLADLVCGSLSQGLSAAIGFSIASNLAGQHRTTWAFLSDGEMEEGQVWEAAMFAFHNRARMDPLVVVIDANNSQVDGPVASVTTLEPLAEKWRAFGWQVANVDGHDVEALCRALNDALNGRQHDAPFVLIARTETSGRLRSIPQDADGHFIKLDPALVRALTEELQAQLGTRRNV